MGSVQEVGAGGRRGGQGAQAAQQAVSRQACTHWQQGRTRQS
jgi:hypothetical protein